MHLLDALERYLVQLQADGRSPHTIGQYRRHVGLLAAWLARDGHGGAMGDIDHELLARFLAAPEARLRADGGPRKPTSANALRTSLRTFFGYATAAGFVERNPARLVRRARCGTAPPRALTPAETDRLQAALAAGEGRAAGRDRVLFGLLLSTGLRIGAALGLDVPDVDLDEGQLRIRRDKGGRTGVVYMPATVAEILREFIGARRRGPLFVGQGGRSLAVRQAQRRFEGLAAQAEIRGASVHSLRHTFATRLYERTGDVLVVKEALRHRSVTSTLVYASAGAARVREAVRGEKPGPSAGGQVPPFQRPRSPALGM